jgi:hypothetical protein
MLHTNERDRVKVEELFNLFNNIDANKEFQSNNSIK